MKINAVTVLCLAVVWGPGVSAAAEDADTVGVVLAVQGTVTMQPATLTPPVRLRALDEVGPLAIFESQAGSRCKLLFTDDSLLTLGENSRLEITEQTFRAGSEQRAFVAQLARGAVRSLVARSFEDDNSAFEVQTGTSVARARGTYFVTWVNGKPPTNNQHRKGGGRPQPEEAGFEAEGATGVANIGRAGTVTFTSGGATVLVLPGQFSMALPGGAPSTPSAIQPQIGPVNAAVTGTLLPDQPREESPRNALAAVGIGRAEVEPPPPPAVSVARVGSLGGQAPSGSYMLPDWPYPITPVTPPAVVSGAAPASVNPAAGTTINLNIRLP